MCVAENSSEKRGRKALILLRIVYFKRFDMLSPPGLSYFVKFIDPSLCVTCWNM